MELTILMPCLNEAETLGACIDAALGFLAQSQVAGEVLVADNGSTDASREVAERLGARVVVISTPGYGAALLGGIGAARGRAVIMGDSDSSYDLSRLEPFVELLRSGVDLVVGNRFRGGIAKGAMPFLHRYLGNPVLSYLGRLFFHVEVGDFHCGLRGFDRNRICELGLRSPGMEFATEMIVRAALANYSIAEVPITFFPDGRTRRSHLRSWRDGWRHLRFLLIFSPQWLFFYPGVLLVAAGAVGAVILIPGPLAIGGTILDTNTFIAACMAVLIGLQSLSFALIARRAGTRSGLVPEQRRHGSILETMTLERSLIAALLLLAVGISGVAWGVVQWAGVGFGALEQPLVLRLFVLSLTMIAGGVQLALTAFLSSVVDLVTASPRHCGPQKKGSDGV